MSTAFWILLLTIVWACGLLLVEGVRIHQKGDLITHVVRRAVAAQHGPFILFAFVTGFLFGHLFWP